MTKTIPGLSRRQALDGHRRRRGCHWAPLAAHAQEGESSAVEPRTTITEPRREFGPDAKTQCLFLGSRSRRRR